LCDLVADSEPVRGAISGALRASGGKIKQQQQQQQQQSDDTGPLLSAANVHGWERLGVDAAGRSWYWLDAPAPVSNVAADVLITSRLYRCGGLVGLQNARDGLQNARLLF
jgi:hypothetical protein